MRPCKGSWRNSKPSIHNNKNMFKRLFNSRFARNVALVATGTAGAQAITMAFSPVITRLYGPEAFGLLGTFAATLAIVTPIAALTYPIAIVLPKKDDDARGIAKLSLLLAFFISLTVAVILLFGDQAIARLLNLQSIAPYLLLIPLAMFLNSLQQIMQQWLIRKKQFKVSARIASAHAGWFFWASDCGVLLTEQICFSCTRRVTR